MKKRILQIVSLFMSFHLLVVSLGLSVNFHYCTEDHHLLGSFGVAAESCQHCQGHNHDHDHGACHEMRDGVIHFAPKCCCEDFVSEVRLTDGCVFSTDDDPVPPLQGLVVAVGFDCVEDEIVANSLCVFSHEKIPYVLSGRLRAVFFSSLKLDPDVC